MSEILDLDGNAQFDEEKIAKLKTVVFKALQESGCQLHEIQRGIFDVEMSIITTAAMKHPIIGPAGKLAAGIEIAKKHSMALVQLWAMHGERLMEDAWKAEEAANEAQRIAKEQADLLEKDPEDFEVTCCSCHISAPCSYCVNQPDPDADTEPPEETEPKCECSLDDHGRPCDACIASHDEDETIH